MIYFIQVMAMICDLFFLGFSVLAICLFPFSPIMWLSVIIACIIWKRQGGFMAWNTRDVKSFFRGMKRMGF